MLLETTWTFDPPVRYQSWKHLDVDNGNWEDYIRVIGTNALGATVPYGLTLGTSHEQAGDILEADGPNVVDTSTAGNVFYNFTAPVAQIVVQYMRGDDFSRSRFAAHRHGQPDLLRLRLRRRALDLRHASSTTALAIRSGNRLLYLGANPPDGENDGQPGAAATTDDTNTVGGVDDEDGVATFPSCPQTGSYTVSPMPPTTRARTDSWSVTSTGTGTATSPMPTSARRR